MYIVTATKHGDEKNVEKHYVFNKRHARQLVRYFKSEYDQEEHHVVALRVRYDVTCTDKHYLRRI